MYVYGLFLNECLLAVLQKGNVHCFGHVKRSSLNNRFTQQARDGARLALKYRLGSDVSR